MPNVNPEANSQATDLANYIDTLHKNGYGNLDPNIQIATAQGATGNPTHNSVLNTITGGLSNAWKSVGQFFHDPSLSAPPTAVQQIQDHFTNNKVKLPSVSTLKQTQQFLIDQGYAPAGSSADGVWGGGWNQSLYQQQIDSKSKPGVGTFSARDTFSKLFNNSFLTGALPLIVKTIEQLPADVLNIVKHGAQTYELAAKDFTGNASPEDKKKIDELVGIHGKGISDLNTALTVASMASGYGEIKLGLSSGIKAGLGAGAKNKATALVTDLGAEAAARPNKWLMNSLFPEIDNGMRRFGFTKTFQNFPSVSAVTNVNKIATGVFDGFAAQRGLLATAYRLPITGVLGQGVATAAKTGLKLTAIGEGEKFLGDPNGPQAYTLDHLKPIAGDVGAALNIAQIALHPTTFSPIPTTKATIGSKIENARQGISDYLQQNQIRANWERGGGGNYKEIAAQLAKEGIDKSYLDTAITVDVNKKASYNAALGFWENKIKSNPELASDFDARQNFINNMSSQILNDPVKLKEARDSYILKPGLYAKDLSQAILNMKSDSTYKYTTDFVNKIRMDKLFKEKIVPKLDQLITPHTMAARAAAPAIPASAEEIAKAETALQDAKTAAQIAKDDFYNTEGVQDFFNNKKTATDTYIKNYASKNKITVKEAKKILLKDKEYSSKVISTKDVSTGKATAKQLEAQQKWQDAKQKAREAISSLSAAKGKNKFSPITDKEAALLNENNAITSYGYQKIERPSAGDAQDQAMSFYKELEKVRPSFKAPTTLQPQSEWDIFLGAGETPKTTKAFELPKNFDPKAAATAELDLRHRIFDYLGAELNRNIKDLQYVPTKNLIDLIVEKSHTLAGDVHMPFNASQNIKDAYAGMEKLGFKLIYGTDVGLTFVTNPLSDVELGGAQSIISRMADNAGLNFEQVDPHISNEHSYIQVQNVMQDFINQSEHGVLPVWGTNAQYILQYLHNVIKPDINWITEVGFRASASKLGGAIMHPFHPFKGSFWNPEIKAVMERDGVTRFEAKNMILKTLATNAGPQFWTRKQVIEALTTKDANNLIINAKGKEVEAAGMSVKDASDLYYAMKKGLRSAPAWVDGLNPFVKMLDSSFGLVNVGGSLPNGRRIFDLTGSIRPTLMQFRYQGSYRFAYLRAIKSALKGVTADIPFTLDAGGALKALGPEEEAKAYALRDAYLGSNPVQKEVANYIEQEYATRDMFNVYNPRAIEARNIYYLHNDALAKAGGDITPEIKAEVMKRFDQIYSYGNRTAAEKTVNAFFFPFSFEKTVVRELGGHLLDDPASRLMVASAIAAYNAHPEIKDWMEKNIPLFKEAEKFNPFFHGVGVGQAGGILRMPYEVGKTAVQESLSLLPEDVKRNTFVQMMMPKTITNMNSAQTILSLIPALNDLNKILIGVDTSGKKPINPGGELKTSVTTAKWEIGNWLASLVNQQNKDPWRVQNQLPYDVQQTNAWNFRTYLMTQGAQALEANNHGGNWQWPDNIPGERGQKVTIESINKLAHYVYPKWDPAKIFAAIGASKTAIGEQRVTLQKIEDRNKVSGYLTAFDNFVTYADKINAIVSKSKPDTAKLAEAQTWIRDTASKLSIVDNSFGAFYKRYYQAHFGPLEGLK